MQPPTLNRGQDTHQLGHVCPAVDAFFCCSCSRAHPASTCKRLCFITSQSCSQTAPCKPATGISARYPSGEPRDGRARVGCTCPGVAPERLPGLPRSCGGRSRCARRAVRARGRPSLPVPPRPSRRGLGRWKLTGSSAAPLLPHLALDIAVPQQEPAERLHPATTRLAPQTPGGAAQGGAGAVSRPFSAAGRGRG